MGLEQDAAKVLNEDVSLCAVVASRGTGGRVAASMLGGQAMNAGGGAIAAAAASIAGGAITAKNVSPFGDYKGYMILAAGKTKLGFFKMKRGLLSNSIGDFLSACPRDEISRFAVAGGGIATSAVDIEMKDGGAYELEVPRASKGKAEKLQRELGF
jgi:hypothetical protein